MGQFTNFKYKVASLLCFAHFGMRICGGAQEEELQSPKESGVNEVFIRKTSLSTL